MAVYEGSSHNDYSGQAKDDKRPPVDRSKGTVTKGKSHTDYRKK